MATTVVCDNSATGHICNDRSLFIDELRPVTGEQVMTIGGDDNTPEGVGTVEWSWYDDDGKRHTYRLEEVYYFPQSPVNLLSVTQLARMLNDPEGTEIRTKMSSSILTWDKGQYSRTFQHPQSGLPEMPINEGVTRFSAFCARAGRYFKSPSFAFAAARTTVPDPIGITVPLDDEGEAEHDARSASSMPSESCMPDSHGHSDSQESHSDCHETDGRDKTEAHIFVNDIVHMKMNVPGVPAKSKLVKVFDVKPASDGDSGQAHKYSVRDAEGEEYVVAREYITPVDVTFCGVGAHHQNAIVERKIKELTLRARTMLLHAHRYWPEYINTMLLPFALKCAAEQLNTLTVDDNGVSAGIVVRDQRPITAPSLQKAGTDDPALAAF